MSRFFGFFIRTSAFLSKEILSILRQPMLVLTLVLGPFLILLLFGLGFRNEPPVLRTLFVVPQAESKLSQQIEEYVTSLGPQLIFMGIISDPAQARESLRKGEVDVVAVIPAGLYESVRNNSHVVIQLDHYEIDPFQIDYINIFGRVYADEINRRILRTIMTQSQREADSLHASLGLIHQTVSDMQKVIAVGDQAEISQQQQKLDHDVDALTLAAGATVGLASGVQQEMGLGSDSDLQDIVVTLSGMREDIDSLDDPALAEDELDQEEKVKKIETDLSELEDLLAEFQSINADVLISPFQSEAKSIATFTMQPSDFYAPAVIALLLQHLAVTFAALSIVQERRLGTMELFRVSPISAFETLLGKYLSYLFFAGILGAILTGAVIYGLGVPMLGDWGTYSLSLAGLIFASLGLGFIISLVARTDSEAVQYSMIILLTSVFFSGAFIRLQALWEPVQAISWAMPATYGIRILQNIMLRGFLPQWTLLIYLAVFGLCLFVAAWLLLRRVMAHS